LNSLKQKKAILVLVSLLSLSLQSIVFDNLLRFIASEQTQLQNIKDKTNKKCIERSWKMFRECILNLEKNTKENINENGALFCFGIKFTLEELIHIIIPPNPINSMFYKCDRIFHLDQYNNLFEEIPTCFIVFIDGNECLIYKYNGKWIKIKHLNALLIKRQSKGGQSSIRFSRLAEESRLHYITNVVDTINLYTNDKSINYVFGGDELKNMFLNNKNLKHKFYTESKYYTFNKDTINEPYFIQLTLKINLDDSNKKSDEIINLLNVNPEFLLFSLEEINKEPENIEYIIIIDKNYEYIKNQYINSVMIEYNNKNYDVLKDYTIIAKKFWISEINNYDYTCEE
jgi:hypothetical protein